MVGESFAVKQVGKVEFFKKNYSISKHILLKLALSMISFVLFVLSSFF